ncbi:MAG: protein of unknown function containing DUF4335 domain [Phormidium sp. OSCR]|nr:MAG: protein of unknown function containing DUF4335 domain [Phormidium sp. OSCR]
MTRGHGSRTIWSTTLRRSYTPPTCQLSIVARRSLLSSPSRPRLSHLRFELVLDDPRLRDEDQKVVRGDQAQLFHLSESVRSYVRDFLSQSSQQLMALSQPLTSVYRGSEREVSLREATLARGGGTTIAARPQTRAATYLESRGLVGHRLVLGTLATADSGSVIELGTLQLFDVLSALEGFLADWQAWQTPTSGSDRLPVWLSPLVGVVVTGGLVAALSPLAQNPSAEDSSTAPEDSSMALLSSAMTLLSQSSQGFVSSENLAPPERISPPTPPAAIAKLPPLSSASEPPPTRVTPLERQATPPSSISPPPPSPRESTAAEGFTPNSSTPPPLLFEQPLAGPETAPSVDRSQFPQPEPFTPLTRPIPVGEDQETAFDFVPQVTELRRYFQQRWLPPEGLNQNLEYTLVLDEAGTLVQVFPLGRSAVQFQEHSQIPEIGEPLASPHEQPLRLRLVLGEQGQVNVFVQ